MPAEKSLISKMFSLTKAILTGEHVSIERIQKRIEICAECEVVEIIGEGEQAMMQCGICKCRLSGEPSLISLTMYEETPSYGCKYSSGSKWKAAGV